MAFQLGYQPSLSRIYSRSTSSITTVGTSILELDPSAERNEDEDERNSRSRSFSPRLMMSPRPPPSPNASRGFNLPMPASTSAFALPHLANSPKKVKSSQSQSQLQLQSQSQSQFHHRASLQTQPQTSSPIPPEPHQRASSAPLLQREWLAPPQLQSISPLTDTAGPAPTEPVPIFKYKPLQPQPHPNSLPPATGPRPQGNWLRTNSQKQAARQQRSALLGGQEQGSRDLIAPRLSDESRVGRSSGESSDGSLNEVYSPLPIPQEERLTGLSSSTSRYVIVFSIRTQKFSRVKRSTILGNINESPFSELPHGLELPGWMPPLLVDGRMTVEDIPQWKKSMFMHWRSWDGQGARLFHKVVEIPAWLWAERNLGRWVGLGSMEVYVQRG